MIFIHQSNFLLSIDIGLCNLGWSIFSITKNKKICILKCGVCHTKSQDYINDRIYKITSEIEHIIIFYNIQFIAIEDIRMDPAFGSATLGLALVKGAIIELTKLHRVKIFFIQPTSARKAVFNNGKLKKQNIYTALQALNNVYILNVIDKYNKNQHIIDAIIVGLAIIKINSLQLIN